MGASSLLHTFCTWVAIGSIDCLSQDFQGMRTTPSGLQVDNVDIVGARSSQQPTLSRESSLN